jgi:hypothetical protein
MLGVQLRTLAMQDLNDLQSLSVTHVAIIFTCGLLLDRLASCKFHASVMSRCHAIA